jgi:hypothetical protein
MSLCPSEGAVLTGAAVSKRLPGTEQVASAPRSKSNNNILVHPITVDVSVSAGDVVTPAIPTWRRFAQRPATQLLRHREGQVQELALFSVEIHFYDVWIKMSACLFLKITMYLFTRPRRAVWTVRRKCIEDIYNCKQACR